MLKKNVPFPVLYYSSNPPINYQEFEGKYSYQFGGLNEIIKSIYNNQKKL